MTTRDSVEYKSNNIEEFIMAEETTDKPKSGRTFDSAYGFSFSIAVGLALFIAGLVISLTLGEGTSIGLIFGIPLLVAGLVIPVFMMRDLFKTNEIKAPCPNCGATIKTSDATLQLRCTNCQRVINVREEKLYLGE
ncbi:MAG: hypothetical protein DMF71_00185 [Acidobacteria bacterium]|nr:MAG: hypothetical protein DMF71_00185 [Acidobacteriota bacterium]